MTELCIIHAAHGSIIGGLVDDSGPDIIISGATFVSLLDSPSGMEQNYRLVPYPLGMELSGMSWVTSQARFPKTSVLSYSVIAMDTEDSLICSMYRNFWAVQ